MEVSHGFNSHGRAQRSGVVTVRVGVSASKPRGACAAGRRGCGRGRGRTRSRDLSKARAQLRLPRGQTPTNPPSAMGGAVQTDLRDRPQEVLRLRRPDEDYATIMRADVVAERKATERRRSAAELDPGRPRSTDARSPLSGRAEAHPAKSCSRSGGRDDDRRDESRGFGWQTRESRGVGGPCVLAG